MRPPGIEAQRVPGAGEGDDVLIGHHFVEPCMPAEAVDTLRPPRQAVPGAAIELGRVRVDAMRNLVLLAPAELSPARVDELQPVEFRVPAGRVLGGNPAAE